MSVRKMIYITGLPCSGKTTIGTILSERLGVKLFDGDQVRGENKDFSRNGRVGMIEIVAVAAIIEMIKNYSAIVSQISPYRGLRNAIRNEVEFFGGRFIEVYLSTELSVCEQRDVKGMYKKARSGEIKDFTGIDSEYEKPLHPEITIDTSKMTIEESVEKILEVIFQVEQ